MSEANENEWVELPRPFPKTLPKGAKLKSADTGAVWVLENEHRLSAMNLYRGTHYLESDITQRYEDCRLVAGAFEVASLPSNHRFEGSEVVKDEAAAFRVGDRVRITQRMHGNSLLGETVTIGSAPEEHDGGHIAFEIVGVGWSGAVKVERAEEDLGDTPAHLVDLLREARTRVPDAVVTALTYGAALWRTSPGWNGFVCNERDNVDVVALNFAAALSGVGMRPREQLKIDIAAGKVYPTADARRIGREEFGMVFDGDAGTPEHFRSWNEAQESSDMRPKCLACGARTNLRVVGITVFKGRQPSGNRVESSEYRCGACEQERRRSEIRVELDRKLPPTEPEKSLAPASWPEDAGDDYEL